MKYSQVQYVKQIEYFYASNKSFTVAARRFNTWIQNENIHCPRAKESDIRRTIKKLNERGCITRCNKGNSGHPKDVITEQNTLRTMALIQESNAPKSLRQMSKELNLSKSSIHRICQKKLHVYPYRPVKVQCLSNYDKIFRCESAKLFNERLPKKLDLMFFSDECTFYTDGTVNRWNNRIWQFERPDNFYCTKSQSSQRITVWAAISSAHLFGPYFYPDTVTGEAYRFMIENFFWQDFVRELGAERAESSWFMQDGAAAHTAIASRLLVQDLFHDRVVGRYLPLEWPPRSPDLSPCDYFLWSFIKDRVFRNELGRITSLVDLMNRLVSEFDWVRNNAMGSVKNGVNAFYPRLQKCVETDGRQLGLSHL